MHINHNKRSKPGTFHEAFYKTGIDPEEIMGIHPKQDNKQALVWSEAKTTHNRMQEAHLQTEETSSKYV